MVSFGAVVRAPGRVVVSAQIWLHYALIVWLLALLYRLLYAPVR